MKFKTMVLMMVSSMCMATAIAATTVTEKQYAVPKCTKPAVSIVVKDIKCKSAGCQKSQGGAGGGMAALIAMAQTSASPLEGLGDGLGDMLTTSLKATGCFDIQDREALEDMQKELALVGKKMEIQQADILITGAITSISMDTKQSSFGAGLIPVIGSFGSKTQTANLTLDLKMLDVNKAKLIDSQSFDAKSENTNWSIAGGGIGMLGGSFGALGGAFSSLKGTAMEEVARTTIIQATIAITEKFAAESITSRETLQQIRKE